MQMRTQFLENDLVWMHNDHVRTPSLYAKEHFLYSTWGGVSLCNEKYCRSRAGLPEYQIMYIRHGSMWLTVPNREYILRPGQAFLIDMQHPHIYGPADGRLPEVLWVHMNGRDMPALFDYITENSAVHVFDVEESFPFQMESMLVNLSSPSPMSELRLSGELYSLLGKMQLSRQKNGQRDRLSPAVYYMQNHYPEKITVSQLAELTHMSPSYFSSCFHGEMGLSPYAYLMKIRMTAAAHLLIATDLPVAEIAEKIGIHSASSFIKMFETEYGKTPGEFRR